MSEARLISPAIAIGDGRSVIAMLVKMVRRSPQIVRFSPSRIPLVAERSAKVTPRSRSSSQRFPWKNPLFYEAPKYGVQS